MRRCVLDGAMLRDTGDAYRAIAAALALPAHFGDNPDALWDALGDISGEKVEIVWLASERSRAVMGEGFERIVAVLNLAAEKGWLTLRLE